MEHVVRIVSHLTPATAGLTGAWHAYTRTLLMMEGEVRSVGLYQAS